ncbi:MAG: PQQ-dependent sugar dehydrogenase, partial [Pseudomonadota bacterium]
FEAPTDANGDNQYQVTLQVSDGTDIATLGLTVAVTDVAGAIVVHRVATGFDQPLFLTGKGDGTGRVLVVEKTGRIRILDPATGAVAATPFLDVSTQIATDSERGLIGLALAPDFATSHVFYVDLVNTSGTIEIRRYHTMSGNNDLADTSTADVILTIPHPGQSNHNGGWIGFGADNLLYIATGDGGGSGDPNGNGQNPNALLGKMLRIDPSSDAFPADANRDYAIPPGNPFATSGGAPEIWLMGLRNPFRNSFDSATGNLWIGDVGQDAVEEVDLARPSDSGKNYGWNILEGTSTYAGGTTTGLTPPILQYPHGTGALQGNTVIGGYVYHGPVTQLRNQYIFADYINKRIWSVPVSSVTQGTTLANTSFTDLTTTFAPDVGSYAGISSFGLDDAGNLYIVDVANGSVFEVKASD